jgi:peptidoglycan/xylan/chitin deacetylase (PgdA/CDA1 family)
MAGRVVGAARGALRGAALRAARPRRMLTGGNTVALTFDDGPDEEFTPQVLDVLATHRVRATFFLVGCRARSHPELVRRIVSDGHAVGSHTWSHPRPWAIGGLETLREYRAGRRAIEDISGRDVPLFRPPKGYVTGRIALAALAARLEMWLWTLDPEDWQPGVTTNQLVARLEALRTGDVVLLHDGLEDPLAPEAEDRSATVAALPDVIANARRRGLELVGLDGEIGS